MRYEQPRPISREEAEAAIASGIPEEISAALLGAVYSEPDWRWIQAQCLRSRYHPDVWVRRNVATCLGHIARFHKQLDAEQVLPALAELLGDPEVSGFVDDALDEIEAAIPSLNVAAYRSMELA